MRRGHGAGDGGAGPAQLPGAPNPRWWQIEDHHVDIGGFSPDRSHLGSLLLLDVGLAHNDDWFWFPVPPLAWEPPPQSSGVVIWPVAAAPHAGPLLDDIV